MGRLSQEGHCLSAAGMEATQACIANVEELSSALLKETKERVELESSMHQAFNVMQAGIEQEAIQRTNLGIDLKSSLEKDLTLFKERCEEEQEELARHMKEMSVDMLEAVQAVERERQDRIQDSVHMKNGLVELRAGLDGARQRIEDEAASLSTLLNAEEMER